jgi:hypothetical protein
MKTIDLDSNSLTTTTGGKLICHGHTVRLDGESFCLGLSWEG